MPGADPVHRVTIVPRGQALGVTYQRPQTDRYNYPEAYLRARIVGMLGGRAAEEVVYGTKTTGAENDIEQATQLARNMVTRWGMSDELGMVQLAPRENPYLGRPAATAATSRSARRRRASSTPRCSGSSTRATSRRKRLLQQHRAQLDALVEALLERETLDEQEILRSPGCRRRRRSRAVASPRLCTPDRRFTTRGSIPLQ